MGTSLTRVVHFHAEHHYWVPEWTEAENRARFGALAEPPGHGHDFACAVTVAGPVDPALGMVMDLGELDRLLDAEVARPLGGRHLNRDVAAFAYGRQLPTCEALARYLFARLAPRLPSGVRLERVRVMEDPTLYADCTGTE